MVSMPLHRRARSALEIVEGDRLIAAQREGFAGVATYVTSTSRHQNVFAHRDEPDDAKSSLEVCPIRASAPMCLLSARCQSQPVTLTPSVVRYFRCPRQHDDSVIQVSQVHPTTAPPLKPAPTKPSKVPGNAWCDDAIQSCLPKRCCWRLGMNTIHANKSLKTW